ncbi:hypothetical protein [Oleidesulfovibrio alaskensis]|jgi:hypothetical protein
MNNLPAAARMAPQEHAPAQVTTQGKEGDAAAGGTVQARIVTETPVHSAASPQVPETGGAPQTQQDTAQVQRTVEEYAITLPQEVPVSGGLLDEFKGFCAEAGLSPAQAQRAADFYVSRLMRETAQGRADCEHVLRSEVFGQNYDERLAGARRALVSLDGRMRGRLTPLVESGWGNHPAFVEMMAHVGEMLGEDAVGAAMPAGGGSGPMSTEDFLRREVFRTR